MPLPSPLAESFSLLPAAKAGQEAQPSGGSGDALAWLEVALAAAAAAGLLLVAARHLWALRWSLSRDRASALPLPRGSMGWPFFGETLHWLIQVSTRDGAAQHDRCLWGPQGGAARPRVTLPSVPWGRSGRGLGLKPSRQFWA